MPGEFSEENNSFVLQLASRCQAGKKGHLHPGCGRRAGTARPLLWLLCCVCAAATGLCPAGLWQSWSSLGLATGPVVTEHRRSWAGVSVVPAPDSSAWFAMSQGCQGLVLSLWCWCWWGCELGSGHIGRLVPRQQWALGRTGCSPACPHSQGLLVPWHSRAAATATAPHPAQAGCTGHSCFCPR